MNLVKHRLGLERGCKESGDFMIQSLNICKNVRYFFKGFNLNLDTCKLRDLDKSESANVCCNAATQLLLHT